MRFYATATGYFKRFECLKIEASFLKKEKLYQKLEYCFLGESTKIENAIFPYKRTVSEDNVKIYHGDITLHGQTK